MTREEKETLDKGGVLPHLTTTEAVVSNSPPRAAPNDTTTTTTTAAEVQQQQPEAPPHEEEEKLRMSMEEEEDKEEEKHMNTTTIPLEGYERFFTMSDTHSSKIAHVMLVECAHMPMLVENLPLALMKTVNMHPRMRTLQKKDSFAEAVVLPELSSVDDVVSHLHVHYKAYDVSHTTQQQQQREEPEKEKEATCMDNPEDDFLDLPVSEEDADWMRFVQEECEKPMDRFTRMPFEMYVWVYEPPHEHPRKHRQHARLILFTNHFMSDGHSGLVLLDSVLKHATCTASSPSTTASSSEEEMHVPNSLFEEMMKPSSLKTKLAMAWIRLLRGPMFRKYRQQFPEPFVPVEKEMQKDFLLPDPPNNPSKALFASGKPHDMQLALAKCHEEKTTMAGAMASAIAVAYIVTKHFHELKQHKPETVLNKKQFRLNMEVDLNMRKRLGEDSTVDKDAVGAYLASGELDFLKNGVDLNSGFWDFARTAKKEMSELPDSTDKLKMPLLWVHQNLHSESSFFKNRQMANSLSCDANLSNMGRYPFITSHFFHEKEEVEVKSVHLYNNMPNYSCGGMFFLHSVDYFCFSLMHKYEDEVGSRLFKSFVRTIESLSKVDSNASLRQVAQQLVEREVARYIHSKEQTDMAAEDTKSQKQPPVAAKKLFLADEPANKDTNQKIKPKSMVVHESEVTEAVVGA